MLIINGNHQTSTDQINKYGFNNFLQIIEGRNIDSVGFMVKNGIDF